MYRIKLIIFTLVIIIFACIYLPLLILLFPVRRQAGPMLLQFASKVCLKIFRVKILHADKIESAHLKKTGIILISNHVSLLDIFLLSAIYRTVYVSKIEVKHYPVIGWIATLMGIVFLRRDSEEDRHNIIRTIADETKGRIITIFPQGTTSSLADPLPFRCGIFKTVELNKEITIQPLTIRYDKDKEIAWTGKQLLIENAKLVCSQKSIQVSVKLHSRITAADYKDRTISDICSMVQDMVLNSNS